MIFLTATIRQKMCDCQKNKVNDYTSLIVSQNKRSVRKKGLSKKPLLKTNPKASVVSLSSNGEMINELKSGQLQAVVLEKAIQKVISLKMMLTLANFNLKSDGTDAYAVNT